MTGATGNGWSEDRKLVEFRIGQLERVVNEGFRDIRDELKGLRIAQIEGQTTRRVLYMIAGAVGGAVTFTVNLLVSLFRG